MLVELGYLPLVIGAASHPEVRSIVGRAGGPVTVLESVDEAKRWSDEHRGEELKIGVVCQTTISRDLLEAVMAVLEQDFKDITVMNTICESVSRRQEEANEMARSVDLMIVAGGRNSSNTAHLAQRCGEECANTRLIEDPSEIDCDWLQGVSSVGVTGGASTPDWLIQETVEKLFELEQEREKKARG